LNFFVTLTFEGKTMNDVSKRSALKLAAISAAMVSAALVGCGKKETPPPAAAAPAAPAAAPAPKAEPLKAAWVYVGPVGDAGWTFAHDLGRKAVEAKFGDKIKTTFVEKVPEGPDAERVIRDLASQGNKLIFATSFGYMEPMLKVAKDFPDVKFEHATGYKTADNMRVYDARFYQDSYLAGMIAGKMTKSNTLGFVGSFPIAEVLRNINAYTLGAQSVNPKVKTKVVWVNTWFDPPKESEAAQALINGGADVLLQNTDSTAVLQTAEKAGKYAFGWDSDMSAFAPKAHLASAIVDWSNYYTKSVDEVMNKTWKGGIVTRWGVVEGQNDLVKMADQVPADVKAAVMDVKAKMKAGTFDPFTGPITDNAGKERLAKDAKSDDDFKGKIDFYVKGVEGKIPAGK
jgi:basic membrane protein A and related proteins